MAGNSYGKVFRINTWGESHGEAIGVVIDGCPAGLKVDEKLLQREMQRRKPGQSEISTPRKEEDEVEILSGVFEGKTTGTPISLLIRNKDQRSKDYSEMQDKYRPSHADYTYDEKYGFRDHRGGGRSSARETAARVAAGAFAKMLLQQQEISIQAYVSAIGKIELGKPYLLNNIGDAEKNIVRCPDKEKTLQMIKAIEEARAEGDSLGGIITCVVKNCPAGLGEPVFDKLHAELGKAMLSINAVKGFEIGSGFKSTKMRGSEHNDIFETDGKKVHTRTNHSGGVQGGISNGEDIVFRVAFKPVATIAKSQQTINKEGEKTEIKGKGRHDPCVVPRAVPIVEAMAALVIADFSLRGRLSRL